MEMNKKGCCGCGCAAVLLGLLALIVGGYLWGTSMYGEGDEAKQVAHDMADYEFPGTEVGIMSFDTFGFRMAVTGTEDREFMLNMLRYPFTSEAPAKVRNDVFTEIRQDESFSLQVEDEREGTLCGGSATVVETNGTIERSGEQWAARGLEACVERDDHIFCVMTIGTEDQESMIRRFFESIECR